MHKELFDKLAAQTNVKTATEYFELMNERAALTVRVNEAKTNRFKVALSADEAIYD